MRIRPENKALVIGKRLWEWSRLAARGASLADRARGRHNFKQLAYDNEDIAHEMAVQFGYVGALKELTPDIAKKRRFSSGGKRS